VAIDAAIGVQDLGRVVALFVEPLGKGQDVAGAKFNAIAASLASLFQYVNDTPGNIDNLRIQRQAPEFHGSLSFYKDMFTVRTVHLPHDGKHFKSVFKMQRCLRETLP
jgi:hypothetical protein